MVGTLSLVQFLTISLWEMAKLGAIFHDFSTSFNFTILHAKVANNSLIIREDLGGYLCEDFRPYCQSFLIFLLQLQMY